MPRYFFDSRASTDAPGIVDDTGLDLPSDDLALQEARRALCDLAREELLTVEHGAAMEMTVRKGGTDVLARLSLDYRLQR